MSVSKVLMFGWECAPFYSGGLGIVTRSIINSLKHQGMDVIFVLPKMPYELQDDYIKMVNASKIRIETEKHKILSNIEIESLLLPYEGVEQFEKRINKLITEKVVHEVVEEQSGKLYGEDLFREVERYALRAPEIALSNPHDVIHAHDWMTAKASVEAKKASGKPLVVHVHATEFDRTGGNPNQYVYDAERVGFNFADKVIAVSQFTKNKLVEHYGIDPDKIAVVHNAIDSFHGTEQLAHKISNKDKIVLFLGRLTMQKGAEYLLKSAVHVIEEQKDVKFVFVGKGDKMQELIDLSIELGIHKHVMFAGFLNHSEIDKAYQMADLYVMPSISEPFGITALEAIKNDTPVIVSKQSGVSEVIHNALKVDFWDIDELSNQIIAVLRYPALAEMLIEKARDDLGQLNWKNQTQKIADVYHQAVARYHRNR